MKIFNSSQIHQIDEATIAREPISGLDLMERAATACAEWIASRFDHSRPVKLICGSGNNGGDGLALTRLLAAKGFAARAWLVQDRHSLSPDAATNLERLPAQLVAILDSSVDFPSLTTDDLIVDALFGTGLHHPLGGLAAQLVERMNQSGATVISIDLPSGLFPDRATESHAVVRATHTLSFEFYKLAFLMPDEGTKAGQVHILPIGLDPPIIRETHTPYELVDNEMISRLLKSRDLFSNKGLYGHALIVAGSFGKMGAAVLASRACLRAGAGLVTALVPPEGYAVMQTALPEAMCLVRSKESSVSQITGGLDKYATIGIGPGLGTDQEALDLLSSTLKASSRHLVLDADALNLISQHPDLMSEIPTGSILTPHPKEFERLFGKTSSSFARMELLIAKSRELRLHILLKGRFTQMACPDGRCFFNPTGNPGMSTGGTGDALTGILSGLLAQGYGPEQATLLGVYLHGLAGDIAAARLSGESMLASDLIENLGEAYKCLKS